MMAGIMIYGTVVALLIGLAALAVEYIAAQCSRPRRGIWMAALALSLGLPAAMLLSSVPVATGATAPVGSTGATTDPERLEETPVPFQAAHLPPGPAQRVIWPALPSLDKTLLSIWIATSGGLLVFYGLSWRHLLRGRRDWRRRTVDGQEVWVTSNLGPAVFGYLRPRMLLPEWAFDTPAPCRALILSHECEHIAARDPWLLLIALVIVVAVPWNPPLWWQLRRLRFSIEVDCDARVLNRGADLRAYGEALLAIGQRGEITPTGAIALTEATSHLERRIRIMTEPRRKRGWALLAGLFCLSCALIATAGALTSPSVTGDAVLRKLPPDDSNIYSEWAEAAARARFPELFQGKFDGSVEVMVGLDRNGAVLGVQKRPYPSGAIPIARISEDWNLRSSLRYSGQSRGWARAQGLEGHDIVPGLPRLLAWFGPQNTNKLYLSFDVIYAWPRPAEDPSYEFYRTFVDEVYGPQASDAREEALNRAILARYFPDVWHNGMERYPYPKFLWVLLDRHGNILGTGSFLHADLNRMPLEIEGRYPGIKTAEVVGAKVDTDTGHSAWVRFYWVAPDSPVTDLAGVDTAKHVDVVVEATASSNGRFFQIPGFAAIIRASTTTP
jgi:beta-lactamase regulating signal transducer with metallopeptidase domain